MERSPQQQGQQASPVVAGDMEHAGESDRSVAEDVSKSKLAMREEKRCFPPFGKKSPMIQCLRAILVLMLLVASVIGMVVAYTVTRAQEVNDFHEAFGMRVTRLLQGFYTMADKRVTAGIQISVAYTSYALQQSGNSSFLWPNVTLPHFENRCAGPIHESQANWLAFAPIVSESDRTQWELFATKEVAEKKQQQPRAIDCNMAQSRQQPCYNRTIADGISRLGYNGEFFVNEERNGTSLDLEGDQEERYYSPIWQISPRPYNNDHMIMFNQFDDPILGRSLMDMLSYRGVVLSDVVLLSRPNEQVEPVSYFVVPVFDDFVRQDRVVGSVSLQVDWLSNFREIVVPLETFPSPHEDKQEEQHLMDVVLKNGCGDEHTFRAGWRQVLYLGNGDHHDTTFDWCEVNTNYDLDVLLLDWQSIEGETNAGDYSLAGFQKKKNQQQRDNIFGTQKDAARECSYSLHIYPTEELKQQYLTNNPMAYTIFVGMMFVLATLLFMAYDFLVERRQMREREQAQKANEIVHSLFPENVRDRLFIGSRALSFRSINNRHLEEDDEQSHRHFLTETPKLRLKSFLNKSRCSDGYQYQAMHQNMENLDGDHHIAVGRRHRKPLISSRKPIADFFPATTIMFADITGFTAWSSEREPSQVFQLLETLYRAFDGVAKRLGVFKVETIGDCYVAVAGLPDPQDDHAVIMARFACECMLHMNDLTKDLEVYLGPGTSDLALRIGLHSGPVTAGVLRGEKSRFQLFGDTMNTASRMESTGIRNRIQVSQAAANLLQEAGKHHWVTARDGPVTAKGKGEMQTYWVQPGRLQQQQPQTREPIVVVASAVVPNSMNQLGPRSATIASVPGQATRNPAIPTSVGGSRQKSYHLTASPGPPLTAGQVHSPKLPSPSSSSELSPRPLKIPPPPPLGVFKGRLPRLRHRQVSDGTNIKQWGDLTTEDVPERFSRESSSKQDRLIDWNVEVLMRLLEKVVQQRLDVDGKRRWECPTPHKPMEGPILDEVSEVITMPRYDPRAARMAATTRPLPDEVRTQLREYVAAIASCYRKVPFHNFEHASHVTMSATKLMKRILAPQELDTENSYQSKRRISAIANDLHDCTFGISSDPLSQFAFVFAALVHDVDHQGVPNAQLVAEELPLARRFKNQSVAEQNSVVIAWNLLMEERFDVLQMCIYANEAERQRFRQLIVNAVMATDIQDSELRAQRKNRWDKAFDHPSKSNTHDEDLTNSKATIVLDHIIQASDVAHTMQHWRIFIRWNEMLFEEQYFSYLNGRGQTDSSVDWYEQEILFFDMYIIPLANKLKECGVYGVSSDEYLAYALENRKEWEVKGRQETQRMLQRCIERFQQR